jgi:hypothetical protein
MGVQAFDLEDDGDWDLFMTHVREQTNTFYLNDDGVFSDRTAQIGLARPSVQYTGFGLGFHDFDQDGELDLYVANGRVGQWRPVLSETDPFAEPDQLFRGLGGGRFEELAGGPTSPNVLATSRTAAFADYDEDGDVDVLVIEAHAPARLLRNDVEKRGHWLGLRLVGDGGAPVLGAAVSVRSGARVRHRLAHTCYSYCAANDPRVHVGLGAATVAEEVAVRWPGGPTEHFGPLEADRYHELRRGAGRPAPE